MREKSSREKRDVCTAAVIFVEPQLNVIMKRNQVLDAEDRGRGGDYRVARRCSPKGASSVLVELLEGEGR